MAELVQLLLFAGADIAVSPYRVYVAALIGVLLLGLAHLAWDAHHDG